MITEAYNILAVAHRHSSKIFDKILELAIDIYRENILESRSINTSKLRRVVWLYSDEAVQQLCEGVILYDLTKIRGTDALISRIPTSLGGVYAWYRNFALDVSDTDTSEVFVEAILQEISKKHCVDRDCRLAPLYRVRLSSETSFSKMQELRKVADNTLFRKLLVSLLDNSILFQQPLYIGSSRRFCERIRTHLNGESILRERLNSSGHNIEQCKLLLVGMSNESKGGFDDSGISSEENLDSPLDDSEFSCSEPEKVMEDILSRLFLPTFTIRYG